MQYGLSTSTWPRIVKEDPSISHLTEAYEQSSAISGLLSSLVASPRYLHFRGVSPSLVSTKHLRRDSLGCEKLSAGAFGERRCTHDT